MGASIIGEDVKLEPPAAMRSMIAVIVITKPRACCAIFMIVMSWSDKKLRRLFVLFVTQSSLFLMFVPIVASEWENIFVKSASSTMMILGKDSSIAMTAESAELVVGKTFSTARNVALAIQLTFVITIHV